MNQVNAYLYNLNPYTKTENITQETFLVLLFSQSCTFANFKTTIPFIQLNMKKNQIIQLKHG